MLQTVDYYMSRSHQLQQWPDVAISTRRVEQADGKAYFSFPQYSTSPLASTVTTSTFVSERPRPRTDAAPLNSITTLSKSTGIGSLAGECETPRFAHFDGGPNFPHTLNSQLTIHGYSHNHRNLSRQESNHRPLRPLRSTAEGDPLAPPFPI